MTFWSEPSLEPKRAFRYLFIMAGKSTKLATFVVKKVKKPGFEITESEHQFLNHTFYFPGKVKWKEIQLTIVDNVGGEDASAELMEMLTESGYVEPNINSAEVGKGAQTVSKLKANAAIGTPEIIQLNSDGAEVEKWTLKNAWIKDVEFGELDYSSEELMNITLTIKYDSAKLVTVNPKSDHPKPAVK